MSSRSRPRLAGALAAAVATGCTPRAEPPAAPSPAARAAAETLARMLNSDNGLMVRTCSVSGDSEQLCGGLRRGGLCLARIRAEDVEPLLDELEAGPLGVAAWHGQVLEWREVAARPIADGVVLAGPDGPYRLGPGKLRIMIRSWTVTTEEGPSFYLEILPRYAREVPHLARLLGERGDPGEPLEGLEINLFLEAGEACVLTCEPAVEERPTGSPPTPGEFLLSDPPQRSVLVFVPSIPTRLFEPYGAVAGAP